jgi:LuxR family quorum-sensing system transcriptional regulator CciR
MRDNLEKLRLALDTAASVADIEAALGTFALALGYPHFQIAWLRQPSAATGIAETPTMIGNIPAEWRERYWRRHYYENDCVVQGCINSVLPVMWDGRPGQTPSDRQRRIAREATRYGLAAGISVPIRGPGGLLIVITFARFREAAAADFSQLIDILTLGSLAAAERIAIRLTLEEARPTAPPLKPVECSCLLWAARGKSTAEIGRLLDMPERTVYFHISNAMDSLGVASRIQAVAEAIKAGIITL